MNLRATFAPLLMLAVVVPVHGVEPMPPKSSLSGPFTHGNLTLFLVHGPDAIGGRPVLTLKEAIEKKTLTVHETGNVNLLSVENTSTEFEVFIMAGDVVKGGKQDRVIAYDLIVPPKSGQVPVPSFCVEQGRWQKRGAEVVEKFSASDNQVVGKGLKMAVNEARQQSEVWKEVAVAQQKLGDNVGKSVRNAASPSSLQLCLEDKNLNEKLGQCENALRNLCEDKPDVVGIAVVINGAVSGADVFGSHELFVKLWPKLLRSAATEALAESKPDNKFEPLKTETVEAFLADAAAGQPAEVAVSHPAGEASQTRNDRRAQVLQPVGPSIAPPSQDGTAATPQAHYRLKVVQYKNAKSLLVESRDKDRPSAVFHRCYIAK